MLKKEDLSHLAGLSRIKLKKGEEERLLKDLRQILNYFEGLKKVDTTSIPAMTGGTVLVNEFRPKDAGRLDNELTLGQFPEKKDEFLKVPPVFE